MKQSADEIRLAEFRALREEAWRLVRADLTLLQHHLEERGIGDRIRDRIGEEAHEVWDYTLDVANEHRALVGATVAALVAWLLREPIGALFSRNEERPDRENVHANEGEAT